MGKKNFIREKKIYCGKDWLEVDIVPVTNIPTAGIKKEKISSEKQQRLNDKNSRRRFIQIAHSNFSDGDYWLHLTYSDKNLPSSVEEAEKVVHNYLNRVKRRMKKVEIDLKYMLVTEFTAEGEEKGQAEEGKLLRTHHHIILNRGLSREDLEFMWTSQRINWNKVGNSEYRRTIEPLGYANCDRLQLDENGLEKVVSYMDKRKRGAKKWSTSQNLIKPRIRKNDSKFSFRKLVKYASTPEDKEVWRKLYKGYEPVKIEWVHNDYTGWSAYIRLRRLKD